LGSPNFHELPINRPKCPFANLQRDGHMQMLVPTGRDNYEPNSLNAEGPRESARGLHSVAVALEGTKVRLRSETFKDHYSQARLFYRSVTPQEQNHMANALTFELSKVAIPEIRKRMLGHLDVIDARLGQIVAAALGMEGQAIAATPAIAPIDMEQSPALRLYGKYKPMLKGRKVGVLLADGFDAKLKNSLVAAIKKEGATSALIAPKVGGAEDSGGTKHPAEMALAGSPSVLFDAVAILAGAAGEGSMMDDPDAVGFLMDADRHLKAIAFAGIDRLAEKTQITGKPGVTPLAGNGDVAKFLESARNGKVWERDPAFTSPVKEAAAMAMAAGKGKNGGRRTKPNGR
jgi:catalase